MTNQPPDEILTILARDSRTSHETIAKMTGRTLDDVSKSIQQYETDGVIKKYSTVIDWEKASNEIVVAFIDVRVAPARDVGFDAVAGRIARFAQVKSVWLVSGGTDLRVVVEAPSLRELASFVSEKLATLDGVTATTSHFLLKRYKEDGALFFESDQDQRLVVSP
ncbi:MAG: Lrp/AsnC family transcriptional regulator [Leptolyngbya sp.]|nr:Lrp/AsnC family transcriptional regulator [Candidatus Melainabacteria bacterium]